MDTGGVPVDKMAETWR